MTDTEYWNKYNYIVSLHTSGHIGVIEYNNRMDELNRQYNSSQEKKASARKSPEIKSTSVGTKISRNLFSGKIEGDYRALDIESITPIGSHVFPTLTAGASLLQMVNKGVTPEMAFIFALSVIAAGLRFKSKQLSDANQTAGNSGLSGKELLKIHGLTLAHLSAFAALGYVVSESLSRWQNGIAGIENVGLVIAGSCCAYQATAVAIKKAKLNIRD